MDEWWRTINILSVRVHFGIVDCCLLKKRRKKTKTIITLYSVDIHERLDKDLLCWFIHKNTFKAPFSFIMHCFIMSAICVIKCVFHVWFDCLWVLFDPSSPRHFSFFFFFFFYPHRCFRCSSNYVCPKGMRVPHSGSFCGGDKHSVRGRVTVNTVRLSPRPCPPHWSGPKGKPLHDRRHICRLWSSSLQLF